MVIMILTSVSISMCVFILHIHSLGERSYKVPYWLHKVVTSYLSRIVGLTHIVKHRQRNIVGACYDEVQPLRIECEELNARYKLIQIEGSGLYILAKEDETTPLDKDDKEDLNDLHKVKEQGRVLNIKAMKAVMVASNGEEAADTSNHTGNAKKNQLMWQDIAEIMDRFFFWLCFIANTLSTLGILVVLPLSKPDPLAQFNT